MQLRNQGEPSTLEPFDERDLPQGSVALERSLEHLGRHRRELAWAAWGRHGGAAEVLVEVERGVFEPERQRELTGNLEQATP
jgi:hypothetical protein